jgi:hypothetical protein
MKYIKAFKEGCILEKYGLVEATDEDWDSLTEDNKQLYNKNMAQIGVELERLNKKIDKVDDKVTLLGKLVGNIIKDNNLKYDNNIS